MVHSSTNAGNLARVFDAVVAVYCCCTLCFCLIAGTLWIDGPASCIMQQQSYNMCVLCCPQLFCLVFPDLQATFGQTASPAVAPSAVCCHAQDVAVPTAVSRRCRPAGHVETDAEARQGAAAAAVGQVRVRVWGDEGGGGVGVGRHAACML